MGRISSSPGESSPAHSVQIGVSGQVGEQPLDLRLHRTAQGVLDDEVHLIVVMGEQTNVTVDDLG